jgi:hypothetical protein
MRLRVRALEANACLARLSAEEEQLHANGAMKNMTQHVDVKDLRFEASDGRQQLA